MKSEIHNLFQNIENFFLTIKKNTSIEEKSCYNISDNLMLKTISYSIVFVSKLVLELEEAKKKEKRKLEDNDYIFSCVDYEIIVKKIFQDVFNDKTLQINKQRGLLSSKYIASNDYIISFDFPLALKLEYAKEINEKEQQEIKNNFVKIANAVIQEIKDYNKYKEDEEVVAYTEIYFTFIQEKETKKDNNNLLKLDDKDIKKTDFTLYYENKEKEQQLKLSIKNKNDTEIEYKATLRTRIIGVNTINKVLLDESNEDYIKDKIKALKL